MVRTQNIASRQGSHVMGRACCEEMPNQADLTVVYYKMRHRT
jgi:hypothetical protein